MYLVLVSRLAFRKVPTKVPTNCWYLVVLECIALDVVYKKKPSNWALRVILHPDEWVFGSYGYYCIVSISHCYIYVFILLNLKVPPKVPPNVFVTLVFDPHPSFLYPLLTRPHPRGIPPLHKDGSIAALYILFCSNDLI